MLKAWQYKGGMRAITHTLTITAERSTTVSQKMNVGVYLFENMTMLDGFGPLQILSFVEQFNTFTFAKEKKPLKSDCGALLTPDYDFDSCPPIDILLVSGGGNTLPEMTDVRVMAFMKRAGASAKYVTSVCTGALILAEAGLLDGYRATTHWAYMGHLSAYSKVTVVDERVVVDRNRLTGGGITAGIDFALTLIAEVVDPATAQALQLAVEYRPEPPFDTGSPKSAPAEVVKRVTALVRQADHDLGEFIEKKRAA